MILDPRMVELLMRLEETQAGGRKVSPEELCRDCPELLPAFLEAIGDVGHVGWLGRRGQTGETGAFPVAGSDTPADGVPRLLGGGRYRLDRLIAEGGFGRVWRAFDLELQRAVAVKIPKPSRLAREGAAEAFRDEARRVAQLKHPGIVPVHDVGLEPICFIVSELVEGADLERRMRDGPFPVEEAARAVSEIARHLHHAHSKGIVHRDIKPANILTDAEGRYYITDFGIAVTQAQLEQGVDACGTLAYTSPEQLAGNHAALDARTDLFSLGVVFYRLLTGRFPFEEKTPQARLERIHERGPTPPRVINPSVPREIEKICLRCLEEDPASRHPDAESLAGELARWLEPRRNRPGVMRVVLSAALLGCLAALVLTWGWVLGLGPFGTNQEVVYDADEVEKVKLQAATAHYQRGVTFSQTGGRDEAIRSFDAALLLNPKMAEAYTERAEQHLESGRLGEAIADSTEAIGLRGRWARAYRIRGLAYARQEEYYLAIHDLSEVIRLDIKPSIEYRPNPPKATLFDAYSERAKLYSKVGVLDGAMSDHESAVGLQPENPHFLREFAWFLATCPNDQFRHGVRAVALARKACELTGWADPVAIDALAAAFAEAGDFDEAVRWQEKAIEAGPTPSRSNWLRLYERRTPYRETATIE